MSDKRTEIEKERKWILKDLPVLVPTKIYSILQFYKDGWRYRVEQEFAKDPVYIKLKKVKLGEGINKEVDIETIDSSTFYANKTGTLKERREISKKRYVYEINNLKFEVDVFENLCLTMMEIEGVNIEDVIQFPIEIEEVLLIEVTGNKKFDNYNLGS
ncbi:MAG: hypothetical protein ABIP51_03170 [Bacteroidia bacterium]